MDVVECVSIKQKLDAQLKINCSEVKKRYEVMDYRDLKILIVLSLKNQIIIKSDYFSKREDVLKDLYAYTFTFSALRIIYRLTKNFIKLNRKQKESI